MKRFWSLTLLLFALLGVLAWQLAPELRGFVRRAERAAPPESYDDDGSASGPAVLPDGSPAPAPTLPAGTSFSVNVPGWRAAAYGDAPPARAIDREAAEVVARLGRDDLRYDAALGRAASSLAELEARASVPVTGTLTDFVLMRAGVLTPGARRFLFFTSGEDQASFFAHLVEVLGREPVGAEALRVGVGHYAGARDPRYRHTYLLVVTSPRAELAPIPRHAAPGERVRVSGRLLGDLRDAKVLALIPGGTVEELPIETRAGGRFAAETALPREPGEVWLEVVAAGHLGPQVVALFPVAVGTVPGDRFEGVVPPDEAQTGSPEELAALLYGLLNADRARFGLAPLRRDTELERMALGHAEDMRDNGFVAHVSPQTGGLADRAARMGYPHLLLGENVARDESVVLAEEGLMRSLAHRENILSERFTHAGIAVAIEERLGGGRVLSIVQNFSVPAARIDPRATAGRVLDLIDAARHRRGLEPLVRSADLAGVASEALRARSDPASVASAARGRLEAQAAARGSVYIRSLVLPQLGDFRVPDEALAAGVQAIGVAAAQSDDLSADPRIWLVLLLAEE